MKQKFISVCAVAFLFVAQAWAGVALTVPDVNIVPGGTANVVIYFDLGTQPYTAFQFDIAYPEGISSLSDDEGNPSFIKGDAYSDAHNVSSIYTTGGLDRFQCFSAVSTPFAAQDGTLLILPIKAQKALAEGTYQATISPIEFVQTDATPDRPDAVTFNITVSRHVVLDESSAVAPASASGVEVQVRRTIEADTWSTICLPFSMTEAQVQECFGDDVQICDFAGVESDIDENDKVQKITVNFNDVTSIEANRPYIIRVSQPLSEFTLDGVDINSDEENAFVEFDNDRTGSRRVVYSGFYGTGVKEIWDMIYEYIDFVRHNGYFDYRRQEQAKYWMYESINEHLKSSFYNNKVVQQQLLMAEQSVLAGQKTSFVAAQDLLDLYYENLRYATDRD